MHNNELNEDLASDSPPTAQPVGKIAETAIPALHVKFKTSDLRDQAGAILLRQSDFDLKGSGQLLRPRFEAGPPISKPANGSAPARGLRVALFSGNYNCVGDGANMALNRLVAFLGRNGVSVKVFSPVIDEPAFPPEGDLTAVPSIPLPGRREYRLALGLNRDLRNAIKAFDPDVFHLSAPDWLGFSALRLGRRLGRPVVASFHTRFDAYLPYYGLGWLHPLVMQLYHSFYGRCDHVLVPSDCIADFFAAEEIRTPVKRWTRGVDRNLFTPRRRDLVWRRSLGFPDTQPVILFVGRLVLEKGLDVFARAIEILRARGLNFGVLIVGDGPQRDALRCDIPDAVFTGHLDSRDLARAYASADLFMNPSTTESFGNVTLEAMASGLPIICANASGSNHLMQSAAAGIIVPGGDASAFATAAQTLIEDPTLRRSFGQAALEGSRAFDWDHTLASVLATYCEVAKQASAEPADHIHLRSALG